MDIRDRRALKDDAAQALARGRDPKKLILAYAGASTLIALVVTLLDYWLEQQISDTGGLRNLGTRSILSTIQTVLPVLQSFALLCINYGYLSAVLRISRRQYADHTDMKNGLRRIGPIIRLLLLQGLLYFAVGMVSYNIGMLVFLFSPLSDSFAQVVLPYISGEAIDVNGLLDEAVLAQMTTTLIPMLVIVAAVFLALALPLAYRFRMAGYRLMDEPRTGAFAALRESRAMMKGKRFQLFRLDLSLWWYYLLSVLTMALCYGDWILELLNVTLPINATAAYFLFYFLYLAANFAVMYCFRNRVELTYAAAYNALRPKPQDNGVVLGNIFDM